MVHVGKKLILMNNSRINNIKIFCQLVGIDESIKKNISIFFKKRLNCIVKIKVFDNKAPEFI